MKRVMRGHCYLGLQDLLESMVQLLLKLSHAFIIQSYLVISILKKAPRPMRGVLLD